MASSSSHLDRRWQRSLMCSRPLDRREGRHFDRTLQVMAFWNQSSERTPLPRQAKTIRRLGELHLKPSAYRGAAPRSALIRSRTPSDLLMFARGQPAWRDCQPGYWPVATQKLVSSAIHDENHRVGQKGNMKGKRAIDLQGR